MDAPARRGSETVLPQIGELDGVVGNAVWICEGMASIRALRKSALSGD